MFHSQANYPLCFCLANTIIIPIQPPHSPRVILHEPTNHQPVTHVTSHRNRTLLGQDSHDMNQNSSLNTPNTGAEHPVDGTEHATTPSSPLQNPPKTGPRGELQVLLSDRISTLSLSMEQQHPLFSRREIGGKPNNTRKVRKPPGVCTVTVNSILVGDRHVARPRELAPFSQGNTSVDGEAIKIP